MSTAEILSTISTISFVVAAVSFVLAVFFWIYFRIPSVVGDLSGRTARKTIAKRRARNEKVGGKGYQPSVTNVNRGKVTETARQFAPNTVATAIQETLPLTEDQRPETGLLRTNLVHTVESQETELLENGANGDGNETQLLAETSARTNGKKLIMLESVMLINTDEVI